MLFGIGKDVLRIVGKRVLEFLWIFFRYNYVCNYYGRRNFGGFVGF